MDISEENYQKAIAVVWDTSIGSVSNLQRKLHWGYCRAAAAIDRMQKEFIVSPMSASGRRDVYPSDIHQLWKELQAAKTQAVPEGFVLVPVGHNKFFSHDFNGDGFQYHDTLQEAKNAAEADLDIYRDRVADGNHIAEMGEFNELAYGVVVGQAEWSVDCVVSADDHKNGEYTQYDIGTEILSLYLSEAQEPAND